MALLQYLKLIEFQVYDSKWWVFKSEEFTSRKKVYVYVASEYFERKYSYD